MFRTILWLICAAIFIIILIPLALVLKLISFTRPDGRLPGACQAVADLFCPLFLKLAGIRFQVEGKENLPSGPALYIGNHQGAFDAFVPVLFLGPLKSIIMKKEIEKVPLAGWFLRFFGCVFLDRSSLKASMKCITDVENELKKGGSVAVFPEGTRSRGPVMGSFNAGTVRSALRAGVPVVPFAIEGSYHCLEETGWITPGVIRLSILPPVETAGLDADAARALGSDLENMVREEVERLQKVQK